MAALVLMAFTAPANAFCRLGLALGMDISSSVNSAEYEVQLGGLTAALRHPDIHDALLNQEGLVYLSVFEWSGYQQQDLVEDWVAMTSPTVINALAGRLDRHRRPYAEFATGIGKGVQFGARLFPRLPAPCERQVIDLSGDGVNNEGVGPDYFRREGQLDGIVINGLVIKGAYPDPEEYYRASVISGPGAFLMVARNGFEDYPDMIREKLMREIKPNLLLGALP